MPPEKSEIVIYQTDDGQTRIDVRMENESLWLTQAQMVELFQSSKANISEHIRHIFDEGELVQDSVVRNFRTTAADGKKYQTTFYNLDVIIAVGYRTQLADALSEVEKAYLDTLKKMQKQLNGDTPSDLR